jgi:sarcosine oxidase
MIVLGGGIVGLATAHTLLDRGHDVICLEAESLPGQLQSRGLTRIFRIAHFDPSLVALAREASDDWAEWERHFERRLVGSEGLLVRGAGAASRSAALDASGLNYEMLGPEAQLARLPLALPWDEALYDPHGGAIRAQRTVSLLAHALGSRLRLGQCATRLREYNGGFRIETAAGHFFCRQLIICAGASTPALAGDLGVRLEQSLFRHVRCTFAVRPELHGKPLSCLIESTEHLGVYGVPVGGQPLYAIGLNVHSHEHPAESTNDDEIAFTAGCDLSEYAREYLPGLDPTPLDEVRCLFQDAPFVQEGDGVAAWQEHQLLIFAGNNHFKLAPALGRLLADAAEDGALAPVLRRPATTH